jgi:hypothetical protein
MNDGPDRFHVKPGEPSGSGNPGELGRIGGFTWNCLPRSRFYGPLARTR